MRNSLKINVLLRGCFQKQLWRLTSQLIFVILPLKSIKISVHSTETVIIHWPFCRPLFTIHRISWNYPLSSLIITSNISLSNACFRWGGLPWVWTLRRGWWTTIRVTIRWRWCGKNFPKLKLLLMSKTLVFQKQTTKPFELQKVNTCFYWIPTPLLKKILLKSVFASWMLMRTQARSVWKC